VILHLPSCVAPCARFRANHPSWRSARRLCGPLLVIAIAALAAAQTLTGVVTNATTNKPAAGDEVILIKLAQGMEEVDRVKTDAKGNFTLKQDDPGAPHLVRAIHQGVTYHHMAPPGTTSVEMQVYDVSRKIADLSVTADVMRLQADGGSLQGARRFAVNNSSSPPRTQMNDQNFEFYLPDGAEVESGMAKTANGQPINSAPVPQKEKNRYAFTFPLRPGQTEFQVSFHMPYTGSASLDPKPLYPTQHFVVVLPKSMQFTAKTGSSFQSMNDPGQANTLVQLATNTQVGQPLAFQVSGTGTLPASGGPEASSAPAGGAMGSGDSRPGGGLGPPSDAPDPLASYRWFILGGFTIVLVAMALYIRRRPKTAPATGFDSRAREVSASPAPVASVPVSDSAPAPPSSGRSEMLFEVLKEELFQLELDHKQGRISDDEYAKARAALEQTLERALKREAKV
jgi:hypothetical protein